MGYCARCGELSAGGKCLRCRGRSIATASDSVGYAANASLRDRWESLAKGPFPKASNSTPIGASRQSIVDRRPLPVFPRPMTSRQGVASVDKGQSTDKESLASLPALATSPLPSKIHTVRSGLSKDSTRNSSFFLDAVEKATTPAIRAGDNNALARKAIGRPRPKLNSQLFFHETAASAVSSPVTPSSPTIVSWQSQDVPPRENNEQLPPVPPKKKRTCCKCNEPLRRSSKGSRRIGVPPAAGTLDDYSWYHYECLTCPVCNCHFTEQDYFVRHGTEVYHPKCRTLMRKNEPKECVTCTKPVTLGSKGDGFQHESKLYHFKCAFICYTCQSLSSEPRKELQGKVYCTKCSPSTCPPVPTPRHRRRCVSSGAVALSGSSNDDIASPSDLFRNRRTALPKLGGPTICPRCNQSISVMDETRGPRATRWHKKCLVCANPTCKKRMDSDAHVYINESDQWLVYCRGCTDKNRRRSSYLQ
ncbi:hypothetical protein BJV82DRAFT_593786 [Fennellomyces sp. T-0311]|nr:hypothetical protein BJV82DRAFT_593786 [Fennellomyces sp. T-0311]